ncbi:UbiX family flavin prenyltransferase [Chlamydiia bacterium]|jgi:flavin prenyltransferase|nr:UbiX family flavin prenyltransferase [Chlamydiia bacterium]
MAVYVLGVSGGSGMILAYKALRLLLAHGHYVHLVCSESALVAMRFEMDEQINHVSKWIDSLPIEQQKRVKRHTNKEVSALIASGTYEISGTLIMPCSMASVAAFAHGIGDNLIRRAVDVAIKEQIPCVIVPRESPFSPIHLDNMSRLASCGVSIQCPVPAWYNRPSSLDDVENQIVGKALRGIGAKDAAEGVLTIWSPERVKNSSKKT